MQSAVYRRLLLLASVGMAAFHYSPDEDLMANGRKAAVNLACSFRRREGLRHRICTMHAAVNVRRSAASSRPAHARSLFGTRLDNPIDGRDFLLLKQNLS